MKGREWLDAIILLILIPARVQCQCISPSPLGLQLVVEYARWRSLDQIVIFDNLNQKKCHRSYSRSLLSCCGDKGIKISIRSTIDEHLTDLLPQVLSIRRHRVGTVIFSDGMNLTSPENILQLSHCTISVQVWVNRSNKASEIVQFDDSNGYYPASISRGSIRSGYVPGESRMKWNPLITAIKDVLAVQSQPKASQKQLFNYYISWLLVTAKRQDAIIDTVLRVLNIGIDSDVIVATSPLSKSQTADATFHYMNRSCPELRKYAKGYKVPKILLKNRENVTKNLDYVIQENKTVSFYLSHVYKIRNSENASLVVNNLGSWNPGSYTLKLPVNVELRNNFLGFPLFVGILNSSSEMQPDIIDEEEMSDIIPLLDIMTFVVNGINSSIEPVPHEKLGTMTNKAWGNLLGDVISGAVDIGLGNINVNDARQRAMSFTHPIIQSMRNIYFHPPESGSMRDIFLQPFNNRLLGCVAATCILIVLTMVALNYAAKLVLGNKTETNTGLGEPALWCIGIMCMQGSPWCPRSPSGKIALFMSLIFALVIYNAYAGFITSILSVQAAGIKSLADLLLNNYKLGYSANDEEYIRNANDSNLRELYIKAYNGREGGLDTTSGLQKASKGGYGFFVSARLARRALRTSLLHNRCSLKELVIPQTFTVVALPMALNCPYKKIINHSVMRISEVGVLSRIRERMLPGMPRCEALTTFHSARLADVYSAFVILVLGVISALTLGVLERVWSQRKSINRKLKLALGHRREGNGQGASTTRKKFDAFVAGFSNGESDDNDPSLTMGDNLTRFQTGDGEREIGSRMRFHAGAEYLRNVNPSNSSGVRLVSPRRRRNVDESVRNDGDRESRRDQRFPFHD